MRIGALASSMRLSNLYLNRATNEYNKSAERIATGKKLSSDLIGQLGQLNNLKAHKITAEVEISNMQSAKDYVQTKEGALGQINDLAQKIHTEQLAENPNSDLITAYTSEITSILKDTKFNGQSVFSETDIAFGANFKVDKTTLMASGTSTLDFTDADTTKDSMDAIVKELAATGAKSNAIDARININTRTVTNLEEAISRIEDVDIAEENINLAKHSTQQLLAANMITSVQETQANLINMLI